MTKKKLQSELKCQCHYCHGCIHDDEKCRMSCSHCLPPQTVEEECQVCGKPHDRKRFDRISFIDLANQINQEPMEWEKELLDLVLSTKTMTENLELFDIFDKTKVIIHSLLAKQKSELVKEIEGMKKETIFTDEWGTKYPTHESSTIDAILDFLKKYGV